MVKIMTGILWALIIGCLSAQTIYDDFHIQSGVLTANQTWEGKNILASDVLIPENITLTLAAGTWLIFNNNDARNLGEDAERVELIAKGSLVQSSGEAATILEISAPEVQDIISKYDGQGAIDIRPDAIDSDVLHRKVSQHKRHYIVTWTLIYSILLVLF